jgi:hypothetical protein
MEDRERREDVEKLRVEIDKLLGDHRTNCIWLAMPNPDNILLWYNITPRRRNSSTPTLRRYILYNFAVLSRSPKAGLLSFVASYVDICIYRVRHPSETHWRAAQLGDLGADLTDWWSQILRYATKLEILKHGTCDEYSADLKIWKVSSRFESLGLYHQDRTEVGS